MNVEAIVNWFIERFPNKCLICSYHRYGYSHGLTNKSEPEPHECIDLAEV